MITQNNFRKTTFVKKNNFKSRVVNLGNALLTLLKNFAELTTLHGLPRIFHRNRGKFER